MTIDRNPVPVNEDERLKALLSYGIMDTAPEQDYDAINRLASYICQTPISLVTFIDADRQWYKSKIGVETTEIKRSETFCRYTIHFGLKRRNVFIKYVINEPCHLSFYFFFPIS